MPLKEQLKSREELEKIIDKAIKKVKGDKENDLCKYIPGPTGGYMHHFTMRKMKKTDPAQLFSLLKKHIVEAEAPKALEPKPRARRGLRQPGGVQFSRTDIEKVLELARQLGDEDLLARFSPKRNIKSLKKDLIRSIKEDKIEQNLWDAWVSLNPPSFTDDS